MTNEEFSNLLDETRDVFLIVMLVFDILSYADKHQAVDAVKGDCSKITKAIEKMGNFIGNPRAEEFYTKARILSKIAEKIVKMPIVNPEMN